MTVRVAEGQVRSRSLSEGEFPLKAPLRQTRQCRFPITSLSVHITELQACDAFLTLRAISLNCEMKPTSNDKKTTPTAIQNLPTVGERGVARSEKADGVLTLPPYHLQRHREGGCLHP